MSDATLYAIRTYRERNNLRPLREVAAEQGQRLQDAFSTTAKRPAPASPVQQRIAAVRAAAPITRPVRAAVPVERPDYKVADTLALTVPVGVYALPRREASSAGNTITFFKVHPYRGGRRIVQLLGGVGNWVERPLPVEHQIFALTHIAEDVAAAAALYGREAKECGFCRAQGRTSPLSNDRSRAAGYGQHCAEKHGLPW